MATTRRHCRVVAILSLCLASGSCRDEGPPGRAPAESIAQSAPTDVPGCAGDEALDAFLADWRARRATLAIVPPDASLEATMCTQARLVGRLERELGPVVGYKAGLTSAPAQERFGATEPVRGVLLRDMLLEDGATVPAAFGARPLFEADLIVVVADDGINVATSASEVLAHLSQVIPFIELPDLAVREDQPLNATVLAAINVAARLGVVGRPIPVQATPDFLSALSNMTVRVTDHHGAELATAPGSAVLGHPLNAVLWLLQKGVHLRPGDYVSVGSIGPLMAATPATTVTVTYRGLPGNPEVSVHLR